MTTLYLLLGVALFSLGLFGLAAHAHLLRKILALNVMGSAAFLILATVAAGDRTGAPDPVPHAMVLTGLVVAVSVTALALAIVRRLHAETGRVVLADEEDE
jgi:multicomponent Na+:H+ antiporter subunit C